MPYKLVKNTKFIHASTLMESLVALAIATLMIWFVFKSIPLTFTSINPERKLEAFFIADSLLNSKLLAMDEETTADTIQLKGYTVETMLNAYDTLSSVRLLSIKVTINKHILAERNLLVLYDEKEN
ncbi:MAG: hypothetical protein LBG19_00445 [Prevotellaceae bacterium]|nr:hypothetical protein [Prevotellaceae bacterium]